MDTDIQCIKLDRLYNNTLTNENYQHLYSIKLEENKYYFIDLVSNIDNEFNLKIFDSDNKQINCKDITSVNDNKHLFLYNNNNELEDSSQDIDSNEDSYTKNKSFLQKQENKNFQNNCDIKEKDYKLEDNEDEYDDYDEDDEFGYDEEYDDSNIKKKNSFFDKDKFINNKEMKILIYENPEDASDKIELIIEFNPPEANYDSYYNSIVKILDKKQIIDFNNKIYFKPNKTENFIISINSDYEGEEGEYSLIIKQVEDISVSSEKNLELGKIKYLNFKKKLKSDKFYIELEKNKTYKLSLTNENLKVFIFGEGNVFSNYENLNVEFQTEMGGRYTLETFSLYDDHNNTILLEEIKINNLDNVNINIESKLNNTENVKIHEYLKLKDSETGQIYNLSVINGKISLKK